MNAKMVLIGGKTTELFIEQRGAAARGPPSPQAHLGGRHAVRRLRSVATLRQQNIVDESSGAIKICSVLRGPR